MNQPREQRWSPEEMSAAVMAVLDGKVQRRLPEQLDRQTVSMKFHDIESHADQSLLDELSAVGDLLEQVSWKCGWLTDELYKNLIANKVDVDYLFVCYFVSVTKLKGQRSMNTVKKWALTARFFPPEIAAKYRYDVLPFSHFAYAASWRDEIDEETGRYYFDEVLEWSWSQYTTSLVHRFPSVADLQEEFENRKRKPASKPTTGNFTPHYSSAGQGALNEATAGHVDSTVDDSTARAILAGMIQNFTLGAKNFVPYVAQKSSVAAQVFAGILSSLERFADELGSEDDDAE